MSHLPLIHYLNPRTLSLVLFYAAVSLASYWMAYELVESNGAYTYQPIGVLMDKEVLREKYQELFKRGVNIFIQFLLVVRSAY